MADNILVTPGTGATIAADDVGSALHQRVKVEWGPDGTVNETDTASGKPLPIQLRTSTGTETGVAANPIQVSLANTATNATAVKVDGSAVTQPVSIATNTPVGNVAHDVADSGAPIKVGARAINAELTAVANNDRVDAISDLVGKRIVLPYANPEQFEYGVIDTAITDTTSTQILAAGAAGVRHYITAIGVYNSHATVSTFVKILDGSTIVWQGYALAAGGGFNLSFPSPIRCTAATAVNVQAVTTGANIKASIVAYKGI